MSTRRDPFLETGQTTVLPAQLPPRYAAQPRPDAMPLRMRVIAAGGWPWSSDGDIAALCPPRSWRRFGSRLSAFDARGDGIWSPQNFIRLQIGHSGTPNPITETPRR